MKTNKAPEKVYICNQVFPNYVDWEGSPINTKRVDNHDIEYTRTDAFIEKAARWLSCRLYDRVEVVNSGSMIESIMLRKEFVDEFRKYMKGE